MKSTATDHMNAKENLPSEWRTVTLGELNPYITSGSRGWAKNYSEFGQPFIRITNLSRESIYIDLSDLKRVTIPNDDSEGIRTQLRQGDLLISITADIGIIGYVDESISTPAYINQHIALARFDPEIVDTKYLAYYLASTTPQQRFHASTDQGAKAGMNLSGVRAIQAELPPIKEQRAIASALSDMDALLAKLDQLIAKKRDMKQAAMQELLTGWRRLPGFSDVWCTQKLRDGISLLSGQHVLAEHCNTDGIGCPYITGPSDFQDGKIQHSKCTTSPTTLCQADDILITVKGSGVGAMVMSDSTYCISRQLMAIRVESDWCTQFIHQLLQQDASLIGAAATGLIPGISRSDILNKEIHTPRAAEQTAIAAVLSDMDTEITALEARREKTRLIKQGMMQELLSGRVRLI